MGAHTSILFVLFYFFRDDEPFVAVCMDIRLFECTGSREMDLFVRTAGVREKVVVYAFGYTGGLDRDNVYHTEGAGLHLFCGNGDGNTTGGGFVYVGDANRGGCLYGCCYVTFIARAAVRWGMDLFGDSEPPLWNITDSIVLDENGEGSGIWMHCVRDGLLCAVSVRVGFFDDW